MTVFDASALLAYLGGEPRAETVETELASQQGRCCTANWSEVTQKVIAAGGGWDLARALLMSHGLTLDPVTEQGAEWAARRWRRGEGLALCDRLCSALGHRTGELVLTADWGWADTPGARQLR